MFGLTVVAVALKVTEFQFGLPPRSRQGKRSQHRCCQRSSHKFRRRCPWLWKQVARFGVNGGREFALFNLLMLF